MMADAPAFTDGTGREIKVGDVLTLSTVTRYRVTWLGDLIHLRDHGPVTKEEWDSIYRASSRIVYRW